MAALTLAVLLLGVACATAPIRPSDSGTEAPATKTPTSEAQTTEETPAQKTETRKPETETKPEKPKPPEVPAFDGGTLKGAYELENDNTLKRYEGVTAADFDAYRKKLTDDGYAVYGSHEIGANRYATLTKSGMAVSLCYIESDGSLTVTCDPLTKTVLYPQETWDGSKKVTDTTLGIFSLDYAKQGGKKDPTTGENIDGNGMGFVITLEDGRFIVIDGGYNHDALNLYYYLRDNNRRADGKIVIAAWIMTHSHPDHYACMEAFYISCGRRGITVENVIANPVPESRFDKNFTYEKWVRDELPRIAEELDANYIMPHAGQVMKFCNAELEILYTHENMAPKTVWNPNEASVIFRLKAYGKSVLFLGDIEFSTPVLTKMYGAELKSDIVQVNHHGYAGGSREETSEELTLIDPSIAIWATNRATFEKYRNDTEPRRQPFRDLIEKIGLENCLTADGACKLLPLNYRTLDDMTTYEFPKE